jgi:hypothetical protein
MAASKPTAPAVDALLETIALSLDEVTERPSADDRRGD